MAALYYWSGTEWLPIATGGGGGGIGMPGPQGPAGESVTVFEQDTEPTALRAGDLWLEPTTLPIAKDGLTLAEVEAAIADSLSKLPPGTASGLDSTEVQDLIDASLAKLPPTPVVDTAVLKADILAAVDAKLAQTAWIPVIDAPSLGTTLTAFVSTGGGLIYLRGKMTSMFGAISVGRIGTLPPVTPRPAFDYTCAAVGTASGTGNTAAVKVTLKTDGSLFLDTTNLSEVVFDGIAIPVK